jgi:CO/xanthine dehydrogenase Mo-binding subunit
VLARAAGKPAPSGPRKAVGRGLASNIQSYGRLAWLNDSAAAWVGFQLDGSLSVRCGVPDVGGGQASSLAQIASELLGVPMDRITVHFGDSALTPLAGTTTATRQLLMSGNAVQEASMLLRDAILRTAAAEAGRPVEGLRLDADRITGQGLAMGLRDALVACRRRSVPIEALGTFFGPKGKPVVGDLRTDRVFPDFTFGTHLCDAEVDLDTGRSSCSGTLPRTTWDGPSTRARWKGRSAAEPPKGSAWRCSRRWSLTKASTSPAGSSSI